MANAYESRKIFGGKLKSLKNYLIQGIRMGRIDNRNYLESLDFEEEAVYTEELMKILKKEPELKLIEDWGNASEVRKMVNEYAPMKFQHLQRVLNLMKGLKLIGEGRDEEAKSFYDRLPDPRIRTVLAEPFAKYAKRFIKAYLENAYRYMHTTKDFPSYIAMLRKSFYVIGKNQIQAEIRSAELTEEEFEESYLEIGYNLGDKAFPLNESGQVIDSFIEHCKKKYPYVKKRYESFFNNKYKKQFIENYLKQVDAFLEQLVDKIIKQTDEFYETGVVPMEHHGAILSNLLFNLNNIRQEFLNTKSIQSDYFLQIMNELEAENNRRNKNAHPVKKQEIQEEPVDIPIIMGEKKNTREYLLNDERSELIEKAVSYIDVDTKLQKRLRRSLTKAISKSVPIKFADIKKIANIETIPEETLRILLDELHIEYIPDSEENKEILNQELLIEQVSSEKEYQIEQREITNVSEYFITVLEHLGYQIPRKEALVNQIEQFCKNGIRKKKLISLLEDPGFGKILLHKGGHKKARVINIGRTGRRLLLLEEEGVITVDSFCNHDDYLNRLELIK